MITLFRRLAVVLTFLLAAPGAALAGHYLPVTPTDLTAAEKAVVAQPAPVQLLFQFKTRGAPNLAATQWLSAAVFDHVRKSGAFSEVTTGPAAGGAVLLITIENIPEEGAFRQGFATGMTFGLAGNTVIDYYICTVEFMPGPDAPRVTKQVRHQIITTVGIKKQPVGTISAATFDEAATMMARHLVTNGVNEVAKDPGFTLTAAAPPSAGPPTVALPGSIDALRQLANSGIPPIRLGAFSRDPKLSAANDKSLNIRLVKVDAPGGSFAGYLRSSVEAELHAAGKLDPASNLELTGFLIAREVNSNSDPSTATLSTRFVLKRDGVVVYDKVLKTTDEWKASFVGAVAIPDAMYHHYGLYGTAVRSLLSDPEFIAAAKG